MEKEILELQKIIEENPEKISQLTDIEIISLNSLYNQQIQEVDKRIAKQKEIFKELIIKISK